jgi:hypothetical protein
MFHAVRNAMKGFDADEVLMFIGPDRNGALLEVGVLDYDGDDPVIIHAMALRHEFYPLL